MFKWDTHYINNEEELADLENLIKKFHNTRFSIDEIRFKTLELRKEFQKRIRDKFVKLYYNNGVDIEKDLNIDKLFPELMELWVTQFGNIKISDLESLEEESVKRNVRVR